MSIPYTSEFTPYDLFGRVTLNIRAVFTLKENVEGSVLNAAVQKAITRYPYLRVKLEVKGQEILLVPNESPVAVYENTGKTLPLCGPEANGCLLSVDYSGNTIGFNTSHMLAGGFGCMRWFKTVLWQYFSDLYGVDLNVPGLLRPGTPVEPDEYVFPAEDALAGVTPQLHPDAVPGHFIMEDYMMAYTNPEKASDSYYVLRIPQAELMDAARKNQASPATFFAAVMGRAFQRLNLPHQQPIGIKIAHNYQAAVGCTNTGCDLVRMIYASYPDELASAPLSELCAVARQAVAGQCSPENIAYSLQELYARHTAINSQPTLAEKFSCTEKVRPGTGTILSTGTVSYTGRQDWGELTPYLTALHMIWASNLTVEMITLGNDFFITLNQIIKDTKYLDSMLAVLAEESITPEVTGPFLKNLAANTPIV